MVCVGERETFQSENSRQSRAREKGYEMWEKIFHTLNAITDTTKVILCIEEPCAMCSHFFIFYFHRYWFAVKPRVYWTLIFFDEFPTRKEKKKKEETTTKKHVSGRDGCGIFLMFFVMIFHPIFHAHTQKSMNMGKLFFLLAVLLLSWSTTTEEVKHMIKFNWISFDKEYEVEKRAFHAHTLEICWNCRIVI